MVATKSVTSKPPAAQRLALAAILLLINLGVWIVPSNVAKLVAKGEHVLLGRYSRGHFTAILIVAAVTLLVYHLLSVAGAARRRRAFRLVASLIVGVPLLIVTDMILHPWGSPLYELDGLAYHRPPNAPIPEVFVDKPEAHRSYPSTPRGFGELRFDIHPDKRGFRNPVDLDAADVVVLGDSFAEGSHVPDEAVWTNRLAAATGLTICNLGMSGYDPHHYLASLRRFGIALRPRAVICMLYEGNDFRAAEWIENPDEWTPNKGKLFKQYLRHSRIAGGLDTLLSDKLGRINSKASFRGEEIFSWIPMRIAGSEGEAYYAFDPKRLLYHFAGPEEFLAEKEWGLAKRNLDEIKRVCEAAGARLIVAYAPSAPHVVLPLVADMLPAAQVRAFAALKTRDIPDDPGLFMRTLIRNLNVMELLTRKYCDERGIPFISLTEPLRSRADYGVQVYYTYDQHWTPIGHEVVAAALREALTSAEFAWLHAPPADTAARLSGHEAPAI